MKQLILDASPLIALFYEKDSYHHEAIKGFTQLKQQKTRLITPIPIIFEVYKWLLNRGSVGCSNLAKYTSIFSYTFCEEAIAV